MHEHEREREVHDRLDKDVNELLVVFAELHLIKD